MLRRCSEYEVTGHISTAAVDIEYWRRGSSDYCIIQLLYNIFNTTIAD